jgi:nucleoside-diphosphate-sugar epimerase
MRVFITGATGFIGTALTKELLTSGHQVLGLTRSEDGAKALAAAGAEVHHGSLQDLDSLKAGAAKADATVHLAFNHDFSTFMQNCEDDRRVIEALAETLAGTDKPFIVTSGTAITQGDDGQPATEDGVPMSSAMNPRAASEEACRVAAAKGVNVTVVRLPQVHDPVRQGLISYLVQVAQQKGVVAYLGDGATRWPAAHISDVAHLYRLALEKAEPGAIYNAVGEEGVTNRDIAEVLGRRLKLPVKSIGPEEAGDYFGWLAMFAGRDLAASSAKTRAKLGWEPTGPTMLADLEQLVIPDGSSWISA